MKTTELPRWASAFVLPVLNLLSALLVAALVIHLLGESPTESLRILIDSAVINPEGLSYTLFYASTFIFTGLSVSIAMKAGLFNIGSEGQLYVGGLGLTVVMLTLDHSLPAWLLIPAAMLGSAVFGAAWAWLPGYLQAKRGSHVVVTTIMFNFIAASLMNFIIVKYLIPEGQQNPASRVFADAGAMPRLNTWFPVLGDTPLNVSFLLAIAALAVYGVMVWRSSWGYKLRATGLNQSAAHYAGVSISRMIIVAMLISGALAGLGAVNSIMGSTHYLSLNFPAGAGFVGIAIALMGRQHPVGIFLSSVLFGALIQGGFDLSLEKPNIPQETFVFIQGLIILFCGAMENLYAPAVLKLLNIRKG
ncbi:ABC transporter permease [Massilia sp. P8910]|uniref:ABC transporter permease n=1 Tax=Massilia antarctica TaxID=2765360 RepID=A0AA48WJG9_9BURK|nr:MULTISPECIES: ABC transporter permease [Massilia]CUI07601.1 Predicted nucleoside ABC transporter, permease 1 component [Janthinobacterium sp. CG23_2]MCE3607417.1 ABC transporter permease [Massilia antarctica]MCY0913021.1 ABC transporter permease [Massilia sp. H27-R4]QPI52539.1 ABC transporter permease [Massilia antarctica]CUU31387.1 Predicted nucleoside ABC transporter, permease 1 component [Janthinobacterium sp. CG23_2]